MNSIVASENLMHKSQRAKGVVGLWLLVIFLIAVLLLWGFAFLPVPTVSAEWMAQARTACFGMTKSGLPAAQGWMLLILGPMAFVSVMWASHAEELAAAVPLVRSSKPLKLLSLLFLAGVMFEAHWVGKKITSVVRASAEQVFTNESEALAPDYPRGQKVVLPFSLINQHGLVVTEKSLMGKVSLFTFVFAHCTSVCPMLVDHAKFVMNEVNSPDLQAVLVTLDPWRDTPSSLSGLAENWSLPSAAQILSGRPEGVVKVIEEFGVGSQRDIKTGNIDHAAQVFMIDRQGKIAYSFLNPSRAWLKEASERLLKE